MRLIDADKVKSKLQQHRDLFVDAWGGFDKMSLADKNRVDEIDNCIAEIVNAPTIEAAPVNNNPCGFCGKFNFGDAKAEVYRHGANIVIASALTRFPVEEQFNFCPVCGRRVKNGGVSDD